MKRYLLSNSMFQFITTKAATTALAVLFSLLISALVIAQDDEQDSNTEQDPAPAAEPVKANPQPSSDFKKQWIGLGLGQTYPMGQYKKPGQDDLTFDFFYAYSASYSFDFVINYHHSTLERGKQYFKTQALVFDIKARLFDFDAFAPYVIGGLGFYRPQWRKEIGDELVDSHPRIVLGANAGAGVDLKLNHRFHFGFLTLLHKPFKVKQDEQPNVRGAYLKVMMTGMFSF